jgi:hypothetical protein
LNRLARAARPSFRLQLACLAASLLALLAPASARAQGAKDTASQQLALSAFGAATGTYTDIYDSRTGDTQGRNVGITAGVDLRVGHIGHYDPSIEIRGTYPFHKGMIASEKNVLGGIKVERPIFHEMIHPYGGLLFGRGEINYQGTGYYVASSSLVYYYTVSNVISPFAGVDFEISHHFAIKADAQFVHYNTPIAASGSIDAVPVSIGVVYKFDFNRASRDRRDYYR